ncbi:NAD(P)/FAD-dependent oxidoreductase [Xanthomonas phaseoli pv. phaseoli]|nr:NAD(P)/FAD-dependent oxidoreductase [Xanthomonas phaseoli pv. phaseoli]
MGASGFGYTLAKQFGHALLPTRAGLVPLMLSGTHQERFQALSGLALPVQAQCNGASFRNFMLLTHRGVSGPAILQISSYWQPGDDLRLDLLPGRDAATWLREQKQQRGATELRNVLADVLPKRFAQRLCELWLPDKPVRQLDPPQLKAAAELLGSFPLIASGTEGYRTAEVTLGGVDTHQVSSASMESRLVAGLYFVGEVLDVTGWLGGYNFQWAWASGHAAGSVA